MEVVRRIGTWLCKVCFQLALFGWLISMAFVLTFAKPDIIKKTLDSSELYARLPDIVLEQSKNVSAGGDSPVDNATIRAVIKSTFSEAQLKSYGENFVDGMYDWLTGRAPKPTFSIDLSTARVDIATAVANRAAERLATLPACRQYPTGPLDPFKIDCLPPGIDINREKQRIINEMLASREFLPNTVITADQLPKDENGVAFEDKFARVPKIFKLLTVLPWILSVVAIVSGALFLFLAQDKRRGIRTLGRMTLATGSFVFIPTLIIGILLPRISTGLQARVVDNPAAPILNNLLKEMLDISTRTALVTSGSLIIVGGLVLLAERFVFKATHPNDAPKDPAEAVDQIIAENEKAKKDTKSKPASNNKVE